MENIRTRVYYLFGMIMLSATVSSFSQRSLSVDQLKHKADSIARSGNYSSAIEVQEQAIKVHLSSVEGVGSSSENLLTLAKLRHNLAAYYRQQDNLEGALEISLLNASLADSMAFTDLQFRSHQLISTIYIQLANQWKGQLEQNGDSFFEKAEDHARKTVSVAKLLNNSRFEGFALSTLGSTFMASESYDSARAVYRRAYEIAEQNADSNAMGVRLNSIGMTQQFLGEIEAARTSFLKVKHIAEGIQHDGLLSTSLINLADNALQRKDYTQALLFADAAFDIAQKQAIPSRLASAYDMLSLVYEQTGLFENALVSFKNAVEQRNKIMDSRHLAEIERLNSQFQSEKKERRIHALERESELREARAERYQLLLGASIIFLCLIILIGGLYYRQSVFRERISKLEAQQRMLRSQMNPHFMFNALSAIQGFMLRKNDVLASVGFIAKFATLMRTVLEMSREDLVSLADEIKMIHGFIDLQSLRLRNQPTIRFDIDPNLNVDSSLIPPLLLQPLVENAIEHGLMPLNGVGSLTISFVSVESGVKITVSNDVNNESVDLKSHRSISSEIIRERIGQLSRIHGKSYHYHNSQTANRFVAELLIPFRGAA